MELFLKKKKNLYNIYSLIWHAVLYHCAIALSDRIHKMLMMIHLISRAGSNILASLE